MLTNTLRTVSFRRTLTLASSAPCSTSTSTLQNAVAVRTFSLSSRLFNQASSAGADESTEGEQKIREILTAKFNPSVLKVQDVSGGCGSFYAIQLSSKAFQGLSTVKAHRMVNAELKDVIKDIHGLQLRTVAED
ncbi:related to AIM1 |uniref:Related to AIM1 \|nr:related to AIM1 \